MLRHKVIGPFAFLFLSGPWAASCSSCVPINRLEHFIIQTNDLGGIKQFIGLILDAAASGGFLMFDTELLKSFLAVAENGGFTRAAKALNSTQSTISAQIQRLENEAGRPLFVRNTRSVRLTSAGEILLGYARSPRH
jgi:hypothetical protein